MAAEATVVGKLLYFSWLGDDRASRPIAPAGRPGPQVAERPAAGGVAYVVSP